MTRRFELLLLLTLTCYSTADYCQDNFTISDFPKGILSNIISMVKGEILPKEDCSTTEVNPDLINLWYWTRQNLENPILLDKNNPNKLDVSKPTIILIPGWLCNVTDDRMPELRTAYLNRYDCNVIGIDWSTYSTEVYGKSFCAAPKVAQIVGEFLCKSKLDFEEIHIVGHSMGGQMAGLIGQEVQTQCSKKINRITALDPAGPMYQLQGTTHRLDATDATSVDVIHTNQGMFGYLGSCGTTDFYPNCGVFQPGCLNLTSIIQTNLLNLPLKDINCNHLRSADYMIESINSNKFVGKSSKVYPALCVPDILHSTAIMGEGCAPTNSDSKYVLKTNAQPPYAQG